MPLETVQSAMHAAFPEAMNNYRFYLVNDLQDLDKDLFRVASWSKRDSGMTRLVIAFQPPWILSDKDITMFQECASVRTDMNCASCERLDILQLVPTF